MVARYFVHIPKTPRKSLKKIPLPWQVRIIDALTMLETQPYVGEKMQGEYSDFRKIKVWPYRIIYRIREKTKLIEIMEIEHRGNVSYK